MTKYKRGKVYSRSLAVKLRKAAQKELKKLEAKFYK